jgi:hypothetical protein
MMFRRQNAEDRGQMTEDRSLPASGGAENRAATVRERPSASIKQILGIGKPEDTIKTRDLEYRYFRTLILKNTIYQIEIACYNHLNFSP